MLYLRKTLRLIHELLENNQIPHALIGGFALACYGSTRATSDIDFLIHEDHKNKVLNILKENNFNIVHQTDEVMQFTGVGLVDFLIARRPLSQKMITEANTSGPENVSYVKPEDLIALKIQAYTNDPQRRLQDLADIQFLIKNISDLDFEKIKTYADLFNEWEVILEIKNKT